MLTACAGVCFAMQHLGWSLGMRAGPRSQHRREAQRYTPSLWLVVFLLIAALSMTLLL